MNDNKILLARRIAALQSVETLSVIEYMGTVPDTEGHSIASVGEAMRARGKYLPEATVRAILKRLHRLGILTQEQQPRTVRPDGGWNPFLLYYPTVSNLYKELENIFTYCVNPQE